MNFLIQSDSYNHASENLRAEIASMLRQIWPDGISDSLPLHPAELNAQSFYGRAAGKLAAYAAVVGKELKHGEHTFRIAGLSCVATLPEYRNRQLGSQIVRAATSWMEQQNGIDFGIFTCHPSLAGFYRNAGAWEISPETELIGNSAPDALSSRTLNVVVLMRFFSAHAQNHEVELRNGVINLDFPPGEFL